MSNLNLQPQQCIYFGNDSFEPNLGMPILGIGLCTFGQEGGGFVIPSPAQFTAAQLAQAAAAAEAAAAAVQATSESKK